MELHDDWKHILMNAWSVRWMILAGVFDTGAAVVPVFIMEVPTWIFSALTFSCVVGGIWARVLCQPKVGL